MMLSFGARCCCDCRLLAALAMLSPLGNLVLFAVAVAVCLLFWCGLGACFCCVMSFIWCLGAVYCCCCCCCCSLIITVLVMHSFGKLVQFTAAVATVYLLSWRILDVFASAASAVAHLLCW
ncbi:hypothetical protein MAM1_1048d11433 [Mucor ambiguus]|uniref:Uncharacterized protein n=1 Tax=Mucor ambiguus TaxID=91626 RepID=A0A0C9NAM2_9FUNG|nr:hypothetical protein MAM1_1048d11433 [Mucor ambiguus]